MNNRWSRQRCAPAERFGLMSVVIALAVVSIAAGGGCARRTPAPVVDAGPPERPPPPAPPIVQDAALDQQIDQQLDATPDVVPTAPAHPRGHKSAPAPRGGGTGGFKVEGSLSKADAEAVLRGARGKLIACYEKERAKNAALKGRVSFRLSIDDRGRVPLAEVVTSTLGGGDPELCMVEALRDLKFPKAASGGESTLSFPMTFGR